MAQLIAAAANNSGSGCSCTKGIFVDTSLDTHLALDVSDSDTVKELKEKIFDEHLQCFPEVGDIEIRALKVKDKGIFYHLSDSMYIKNAFVGVTERWSVSVDAIRREGNREYHYPVKSNSGKLLAITNNPAAHAVDHLVDGCLKSSSGVDDLSKLQVGNVLHVNETFIANESGSGHASGKVLDDLDMEGENADKTSGHKLPENIEFCSNEFEDSGTYAQQRDFSFKNRIVDEKNSMSLGGTPQAQSFIKKKHKSRRKNKDGMDDHFLKDNDASVHEYIIIAEDLHKALPRNIVKSDTIEQMSQAADESAAPGEHVELETDILKGNFVDGESGKQAKKSSRSGTTAIRKRKAVEMDGNGNSSMENGGLIDDTVKSQRASLSSGTPAMKQQKTIKRASDEKASNENQGIVHESAKQFSGSEAANAHGSVAEEKGGAAFDNSVAVTLEDDHMLTTSSTSVKRNRKRRSPNGLNQTVDAGPFSRKDVRVENSLVMTRTNPKYSDERVHGGLISGPEEMLSDAVEEVKGLDTKNDSDTGDIEDGIDFPGSPAMNVDGHPTILNRETENSKDDDDINNSRWENTILDENTKSEAGEEVREQEAVATNDLLDANLEPKTQSKKRRKSKKAKDYEGGPVSAGIDPTIGSTVDNCSTDSCEAIHTEDPSEKAREEKSIIQPTDRWRTKMFQASPVATDKEADVVIQNVLESLQQGNENPVAADTVGEISRKKKKKKQGSSGRVAELPKDNEDNSGKLKISAREPVSSCAEHMILATNIHEAVNTDQVTETLVREENLVRPPQELETKALNKSLPTTDREDLDVIQNVAVSLQQVNENSIDDRTVADKARKRKKRMREENIMQLSEGLETKMLSRSLPTTDREDDGDIPNVTVSLLQTIDNKTVADKSRKKKKMREENLLQPLQGRETKTLSTSLQTTNTEDNDVIQNVELSLQQVKENTIDDKTVGDKSKKKKKMIEQNLLQPLERLETKKLNRLLQTPDKEDGDVIQNVAESLQQVHDNAIEEQAIGDKSRKKKKSQGSTETDHRALQKDVEDIGDKSQEVEDSARAPVLSGIILTHGFTAGKSSIGSHEVPNIKCTDAREEKTTGDKSQKVAESVQQVHDNAIDEGTIGEKSRKKKKKRQRSTESDRWALQKDIEDIGVKSQKVEDSARTPVISGIIQTQGSTVGKSSIGSHEAVNIERTNAKTKGNENIMQSMQGTETKTLHVSLQTTDRETNGGSRGIAESFQQVSDGSIVAQTVVEKSRKRKKKLGSHEKDHSELQKEKVHVSGEYLKMSTGTLIEDDASFPHDTVNGSSNKNRHATKTNEREVNVNNDSMLHQHQPETGEELAGKVKEMKQPDNELQSKMNGKKDDVESNDASADLQNLVMPDGINQHRKEDQADNSGRTEQQRSTSKDGDTKPTVHLNEKLPKVSASQLKPPRPVKSNSVTQDVQRPKVSTSATKNVLKKSKESLSNSTFESSQSIANKKKIDPNISAGRQTLLTSKGKSVNGSLPKRSLLAASSTIFGEHTDGSSEDEADPVDLDSITRTPSDASISSDYSDGESNANFKSPVNGFHISKGMDTGKDITGSYSSAHPKAMSLDAKLRLSSSYKKAKLSAVQFDYSESQPLQPLDTDSQPNESVPDSQPNV